MNVCKVCKDNDSEDWSDVTTVANIFKQAACMSTSPRVSQTTLCALDPGLESQVHQSCPMFIAEHCILTNAIMLTNISCCVYHSKWCVMIHRKHLL